MNLFEPVYVLSAAIGADGIGIATKAAGAVGGSGLSFQRYADANNATRMPTDRELIGQLMGTVYACAHLNSESVAAGKLRMFVKTGKGQTKTRWQTAAVSSIRRKALALKTEIRVNVDDDLQEIVDHPLLTLLNPDGADDEDDEGQPRLSGFDLIYCTQLYLETIGRAYWWVERDGLGMPMALHLLRSQFVREVPDKDNPGRLAGYAYGNEQEPRFLPKDVIKFHNPDLSNPIVGGFAPLTAMIEDVRINREFKANLQALLKNSSRPDAIWSPKGDSEGGGIGEAEARRVRGAMQQEFNKAGRGGLLVSESPGNLQILGWRPQDVVEIQQAKEIKNNIMNGFGVPNAMLDLNEANLASASAAEYQYGKRTIRPRCMRLARALRRLVLMFDTSGRFVLTYDDPTPDDKAFNLEQTRTGVSAGFLSVNEGREAIGEGPIAGGDVRYVTSDLVAIHDDGTLAPANQQPGTAAAPPPGAPPDMAPKLPAPAPTARAIARAVGRNKGLARMLGERL